MCRDQRRNASLPPAPWPLGHTNTQTAISFQTGICDGEPILEYIMETLLTSDSNFHVLLAHALSSFLVLGSDNPALHRECTTFTIVISYSDLLYLHTSVHVVRRIPIRLGQVFR